MDGKKQKKREEKIRFIYRLIAELSYSSLYNSNSIQLNGIAFFLLFLL